MSETLGEFLKKLRKDHHWTQAQVARHLGTSRQAYAYYENSSSIPDLETLIRLSTLYQVPFQIFLLYVPCGNPDLISEAFHYSANSYEQDIYPEFLNFFSQQENMKKYHYLNRSEKEMLFMFQKLTERDQHELLHWAYFKTLYHSDTDLFSTLYHKE